MVDDVMGFSEGFCNLDLHYLNAVSKSKCKNIKYLKDPSIGLFTRGCASNLIHLVLKCFADLALKAL